MTVEAPRTPMSQQEESVLKKVVTVRPGGRRRRRRLWACGLWQGAGCCSGGAPLAAVQE